MTLEYRCSNCGTLLQTTNADAVDAKIERLRSALRDLLDAYLADVNPNDRNQAAIEHARRNIQ